MYKTDEERKAAKLAVQKKWRENNKEKIKEAQKKYRLNNLDKCQEREKNYSKNNPLKVKESKKKWRDNNKEQMKEIQRKYGLKNRDKQKEYSKEYLKNNPLKRKATCKKYRESNKNKQNEYFKIRRRVDPLFKLSCNIKGAIYRSIIQNGFIKKSRTEEILGCTYEEFKKYLETKFEYWMTWENYGNWNGIAKEINVSWDIDHIIPLNTAITEEDIIKLNHYSNLQPLCSFTNRWVKSGG